MVGYGNRRAKDDKLLERGKPASNELLKLERGLSGDAETWNVLNAASRCPDPRMRGWANLAQGHREGL
jgi:hypothetical protein